MRGGQHIAILRMRFNLSQSGRLVFCLPAYAELAWVEIASHGEQHFGLTCFLPCTDELVKSRHFCWGPAFQTLASMLKGLRMPPST